MFIYLLQYRLMNKDKPIFHLFQNGISMKNQLLLITVIMKQLRDMSLVSLPKLLARFLFLMQVLTFWQDALIGTRSIYNMPMARRTLAFLVLRSWLFAKTYCISRKSQELHMFVTTQFKINVMASHMDYRLCLFTWTLSCSSTFERVVELTFGMICVAKDLKKSTRSLIILMDFMSIKFARTQDLELQSLLIYRKKMSCNKLFYKGLLSRAWLK